MIIYICPLCGRLGKQPVPEELSDAVCGYCGNVETDFISRPDIGKAIRERDKTEEETLCCIENEVLVVLERAYDIYDETVNEGNSVRRKQARLASIRLALERLFTE